jgi:hypothetical protein
MEGWEEKAVGRFSLSLSLSSSPLEEIFSRGKGADGVGLV